MPFPLALLAPLIPVLASYVPDIGRLIAGGVGEEVGHVVRRVAGSLDPNVVAATLADPDKASEIIARVEEIRAGLEEAKLQHETQRIEAALRDVADARASMVALAGTGSRLSWAPAIISGIIVVGFFACIVLFFVVERRWDERTTNIANTLLGALTLAFGQVYNYWLGSTRTENVKDDRVAATMQMMHSKRGGSEAPPAEVQPEIVSTPAEQPRGGRLFNRS